MDNRYRIRPVEVEAYQYTGDRENRDDWPDWLQSASIRTLINGRVVYFGESMEIRILPSDWFVLRDGRIRVYRAGRFEQKFEKVNPE